MSNKKSKNIQNYLVGAIILLVLFIQFILVLFILQPTNDIFLSFSLTLFWPALLSILAFYAYKNKINKYSFFYSTYFSYVITTISSLYYLLILTFEVFERGKNGEHGWIILLFPTYGSLFVAGGLLLGMFIVLLNRFFNKK